MKKQLFLLGLAVAAMSSCTNDEVVEMQQSTQKTIGFDAFVNKETRGIGSTTSDIEKIYVTAYYLNTKEDGAEEVNVFNNQLVTKTGSIWDYEGTQYWTTNDYYFAAVAEGNAEVNKPTDFTLTGKKLTIDRTLNYNTGDKVKTTSSEKDLVADFKKEIGTQARPTTQTVDFTLNHLYSKIKFTIKNTDPESLTLKITDLKINGVKSGGRFTADLSNASTWTLATSCWDVSTAATLTNFTPILEGTLAKDETFDSEELYVIPQSLDGVTFTITASFYDDKNNLVYVKKFDASANDKPDNDPNKVYKGAVSVGEHTLWKPSNIYHYTINLPSSATRITFGSVGLGTWESNDITLN